MPSERTDTMLEMVALWNAGDAAAFIDAQRLDFEFTPDPSFPDGGTLRGEQLRTFLREWGETFAGSQIEVLEITERGPAALGRCRWHMRGSKSQVEIPLVDFTYVAWFTDGKMPSRAAAFFEHDAALAAVDADAA